MLRLTNRFFPVVLGVLTSVVCGIGMRPLHTEVPKASGHFTSEQILAKTRALSPWVPTLAGAAAYSTDRLPLYRDFTFQKPGWIVECFNAANRSIGHLLWDADTGRLLEATVASPVTSSPPKPFTPRQATDIARDWLSALLPPERSGSWHLSEPPSYDRNHWNLLFRTQDRTATIRIDSAGRLLLLRAL